VPLGRFGHGLVLDQRRNHPAMGEAAAQYENGDDDPNDGSDRHVDNPFPSVSFYIARDDIARVYHKYCRLAFP
jgi:hypothetical protein